MNTSLLLLSLSYAVTYDAVKKIRLRVGQNDKYKDENIWLNMVL